MPEPHVTTPEGDDAGYADAYHVYRLRLECPRCRRLLGPYLTAYILATADIPRSLSMEGTWDNVPSGGYARFVEYMEMREQRNALLAVAKAARDEVGRDLYYMPDTRGAFEVLDAAHPDWRTW